MREAGEQAMLVAEKTAPEQSSFWGAEAYRMSWSQEIGQGVKVYSAG
jgi:hypothetical protein